MGKFSSILLVFAAVLGLAGAQRASAACSQYRGQIVMNEVQDPSSGTTYLELRTLNPGIAEATSNFDGWKIAAYRQKQGSNDVSRTSTDFSEIFTDSDENKCGQSSAWILVPDKSLDDFIEESNGVDNLNFVLYENSGKQIVDILRLGSATSFYGAGSNYASCPEIESSLPSSQYDASWGGKGNKDWYRTPDGTGTWGGQVSSNVANSVCGSNDGSGQIGLTKVASVASVDIDTNFTFTLYAQNGATGSSTSNVQITDDLNTAGLTFVSCTTANGTCTNASGVVTWNIGTMARSTTKSATLTVRASAAGLVTNRITANTSNTPTASASVTVNGPTASSFSAYETSVSNASAATAANRIIKTRVAGNSGSLCQSDGSTCRLNVAAFESASVASSYSGTVSASLEYCTNVGRSGAGASSTVACGGSWSPVSGVTAQSVSLAAGVGTVLFPFVNNAYEVVRVKLVSSTISGGPWYSNDDFAVRPSALTVSASDSTASAAGSTRSLTSGANTHKAMAFFTLGAQALVASGATAGNYPGSGFGPVTKSVLTTNPSGAGVVNGVLSTGAWSGSGTLTSSTATYSEVGTFTLTLEDQNFANIDSADTPSADRYFSGSASVGAFTPDRFRTVVTPGCVASSFTYSGQAFRVQVHALNASGFATLNYGLTSNSVVLSDATANATGVLSNTAVASSAFSVATGIATSLTPTFTFSNKATAPSAITVRAVDLDRISSSGYETSASTTVRSGRIRLQNAYGSDLLALPIPTAIEQYGAQSWGPATDACTSIAAGNFSFAFSVNPKNQLTACETMLSVSGSNPNPAVSLSRPGAGNSGWTDITLNLGSAAIGLRCVAVGGSGGAETPANLPWLQFDWKSTGVAGNPVARATFGLFTSPLIYRRENY